MSELVGGRCQIAWRPATGDVQPSCNLFREVACNSLQQQTLLYPFASKALIIDIRHRGAAVLAS